jgi:hypothetical protein
MLVAIARRLEAMDGKLDELSQRLDELTPPPPPQGWMTTRQKADQLGTKQAYVRRHAPELGGRKLGSGPQGRWRFPPSATEAGELKLEIQPSPPPPRRRPRRLQSSVQLLPIRAKRHPRSVSANVAESVSSRKGNNAAS